MKTLKQLLIENISGDVFEVPYGELIILSVKDWLQQKFDKATPHTKERQIINELLREANL